MEIQIITSIAILGYIPLVLYIANLKIKYNMLNFKKEKWLETAMMIEKERKEIVNGKIYPNQ